MSFFLFFNIQSPQATAGTDGFFIHSLEGTKHQKYAQTNWWNNKNKILKKIHKLFQFFTHIDLQVYIYCCFKTICFNTFIL